jgi:hypothetical protein
MKDIKKDIKIEPGHCPKCNALPKYLEVWNYDPMWHDGDIYCRICKAFIRKFDAG